MNLSNLRQSHPLLLTHMKEIGYSERYIHSIQIEINRILFHEKDNSWNSYQDIYQNYASGSHSKRSLLGKATLIGMIAHFDFEGLYPGKHQWHTLWERGVYTQLIPGIQNTAWRQIPFFCLFITEGKMSSTSHRMRFRCSGNTQIRICFH